MKKTRQKKNLELGSDLIRSGKALEDRLADGDLAAWCENDHVSLGILRADDGGKCWFTGESAL